MTLEGTSHDISEAQIRHSLAQLGIAGKPVVVHASMKKIGHFHEGPESIIRSLTDAFSLVMMPAFCFDSNAAPPLDYRPSQNGCDYRFYDHWPAEKRPFIVSEAGIDYRMGKLPKEFLKFPGTVRSDHAWHSWAANGKNAREIIANHPWSIPNLPLERLSDRGGWMVLIGVGLTACTAVHLAEERAGRRPFIRWMTNEKSEVHPIRVAGCAQGFERFFPQLRHLFQVVSLGLGEIRAAPIKEFVGELSEIIKKDPTATACSPNCMKCRDAILGGPEI